MMTFRIALPALIAGAVALSACSKQHEAAQPAQAPAPMVKGVTVETVKSTAVADLLDVVGTVRARTSAVVSTRIPGTVSVLRVREGDRVKKGQLLAQLDAQENVAAAAGASALIDEARRGLDEALSRKKLADATYERYQKLFTDQAVSRQEFEVKQMEKDVAAQGAARAEARLKQAQEGARGASAVADYTRIVAPISGIITAKQADLGGMVFPGQPFMTIEDEGSYQLELSLPETAAAKVRPGTQLQVTLDAAGAPFAAKIAELVPAADPASRTVTAKIPLNRAGVRSGMFGRGSVALGTSANGIVIPKRAIFERGALTAVWAVDKDKAARMRIVKAGRRIGEGVEILSGLMDGDRIAVAGTDSVTEGAKVE